METKLNGELNKSHMICPILIKYTKRIKHVFLKKLINNNKDELITLFMLNYVSNCPKKKTKKNKKLRYAMFDKNIIIHLGKN